MILTDTRLMQIWNETANSLGGKLTFLLQKHNGGHKAGGLYIIQIELVYKNISVFIQAFLLEIPLEKDEYNECAIKITAKKLTQHNYELSIWKKDIFDKLFNFSIPKTGYKDFDKVISLKPNIEIKEHLSKIFKNEKLRMELIAT